MSQKYRKGAYHGKTEELCTARELWWWLKIAVFFRSLFIGPRHTQDPPLTLIFV